MISRVAVAEARMEALKIVKHADSLCLVLSPEAVSRLQVKEGDEVYLDETPDGALRLMPRKEELARQLAMAGDIMREEREVLSELARR